jgi:hypothetical protein
MNHARIYTTTATAVVFINGNTRFDHVFPSEYNYNDIGLRLYHYYGQLQLYDMEEFSDDEVRELT